MAILPSDTTIITSYVPRAFKRKVTKRANEIKRKRGDKTYSVSKYMAELAEKDLKPSLGSAPDMA